MTAYLLLVDDDDLLRRSLAFNLEKAGYRVSTAATAEDALLHSQRQRPDLVVLDIGLPGMDGLEALRQFHERFNVPIILLTARRREFDQVLGLELGADDYVTKPFDFDVLAARIKAVLRRTPATMASPSLQTTPLTVGDLVIDPQAHTVTLRDQSLDLAPREFDLLYALALSAGRVVSAEDLIARVWGAEYSGEPQVVYVHIRWLREKIEDDPNHPRRIVTVRGVGYKLEPQVP
jgi:DNA-binding response OmpR family regulator